MLCEMRRTLFPLENLSETLGEAGTLYIYPGKDREAHFGDIDLPEAKEAGDGIAGRECFL